LRLGGFWPRGQAVLNVVRPRLSLGTKGRREHTADTAMGFLEVFVPATIAPPTGV
jgi:hypothetical protein